jgi:hypothetical protein
MFLAVFQFTALWSKWFEVNAFINPAKDVSHVLYEYIHI